MQHDTDVRQQVDGDYLSFWAYCKTCGWRDRIGRDTREEAENEADEHVLAAIEDEP